MENSGLQFPSLKNSIPMTLLPFECNQFGSRVNSIKLKQRLSIISVLSWVWSWGQGNCYLVTLLPLFFSFPTLSHPSLFCQSLGVLYLSNSTLTLWVLEVYFLFLPPFLVFSFLWPIPLFLFFLASVPPLSNPPHFSTTLACLTNLLRIITEIININHESLCFRSQCMYLVGIIN